jgi:hypothetical protein
VDFTDAAATTCGVVDLAGGGVPPLLVTLWVTTQGGSRNQAMQLPCADGRPKAGTRPAHAGQKAVAGA